MTTNNEDTPWKDGHYKAEGLSDAVEIEGRNVKVPEYPDIVMTITFGDFGDADDEVMNAAGGQTKYNVEMKYEAFGLSPVDYGVMDPTGVKFAFKSMFGLWTWEWITAEEAERRANDGDPILEPVCPYKIQPEKQGKLIWITGPPGLGKSTSAQLLARKHGYVFYEGDCFFTMRNPFIPVDSKDPSLDQLKQRKLVGPGADERRVVAGKGSKAHELRCAGQDYNESDLEVCFKAMCEDVIRQRKRIGGDWAIACVLDYKRLRQLVRGWMPPEFQIVVLDMTLEEQMERVRKRHAGDERMVEFAKAIYALSEPAGEEEANTIDLKVTLSMTPDDVAEKILELTS